MFAATAPAAETESVCLHEPASTVGVCLSTHVATLSK